MRGCARRLMVPRAVIGTATAPRRATPRHRLPRTYQLPHQHRFIAGPQRADGANGTLQQDRWHQRHAPAGPMAPTARYPARLSSWRCLRWGFVRHEPPWAAAYPRGFLADHTVERQKPSPMPKTGQFVRPLTTIELVKTAIPVRLLCQFYRAGWWPTRRPAAPEQRANRSNELTGATG